ncbi:MAG: O-antigen ligase family protein [Patescibacteria group bacterium]|nr:O-antigen ligase family protein [Patescibacteria group bacterium]
MKRKNDKTNRGSALLWLIFGCSILALATPLLKSPVASMPVTFVQTLAFNGLVEVAFIAWLALIVLDRSYRPKQGIVLIAFATFAAVALISLFFVPDPSMSMWSRIWRMSGVWWLLHLFVWFLVLHSSLRNREDWRQLLGISCMLATVAFTIGFTRWLRVPTTQSIAGTLGNPSHMAAYLLPHVFIAGYLLIGSTGFKRKALITAIVAFSVGVFMTGSRGGAVALLFGILMAVGLLVLTSGIKRRTKLFVGVAVAVLLAGSIVVVLTLRAPAAREWGESVLPKFAQRLIYRDFGGDRWFLWEYALKGAAERPVFGWGNEGFAYLYDHHYDHESHARDVFYERWQDRAHNRYLDILVAYGGVGLAAYLFLWISIFIVTVFRHLRVDTVEGRRRGLVLFTLLSTIVLYDLFMLETVAQSAVVMLLFGLVASGREPEEEERASRGGGALHSLAVLLVMVVAAVLVIFTCVMPFIRGIQFDEAGQEIVKDPERAAEIFETAFSWPNVYRNEMIYGGVFTALKMEVNLPIGDMEPLVRLLAVESRKAADGAPLSTRETMMAAQSLRLLAYYDPSVITEARSYAERLRDMAPGKFDGYFEIAELDLFEGAPTEALRNLELAAERVYIPRKEFANLVEIHRAAAHAALGDYGSMFNSLKKLSDIKYPLASEPLPVILMNESLTTGSDVPDGLIGYAEDVAKANPKSLRAGLAAARIMAMAGRGENALTILEGLAESRPDAAAAISALRDEIIDLMNGNVEEETE